MTLSLDGESRLRRIRRWGVESGGLRATSILLVMLLLLAVASVVAHETGWVIDVAATGVVFVALELGLLRGLALTAGMGYLADLFSGQPRGLWLAGSVVSFLALRLFVFRVEGARPVTVALLGGFSALVAGLARMVLQASVGPGVAEGTTFGFFGAVLGASASAYPAYLFLDWASDRFRSRDESKPW